MWCRERLQEHFEALPEAAKARVRSRLEALGAWEPLWRDGVIRSHLHDDGDPPVCRPTGDGLPLGRRGWTAWNRPGAFGRRANGVT